MHSLIITSRKPLIDDEPDIVSFKGLSKIDNDL